MARDTILFDINETVLDLSALRPKFAAAFATDSVTDVWFARLLHTSTVCALTGVETGFAQLAGSMLDFVASGNGISLNDDQRTEILSTFAGLKPFPDVAPALQQLRQAGYRTVAFSNSSQALIANQVANSGLGDLFDMTVSVESTGTFKPDPAVYRYAAEQVDRPIDDLRLVACHDWDTHGALATGMAAAYINRSGTPYHPLYRQPTVSADNMGAVAELVIAEDAS